MSVMTSSLDMREKLRREALEGHCEKYHTWVGRGRKVQDCKQWVAFRKIMNKLQQYIASRGMVGRVGIHLK